MGRQQKERERILRRIMNGNLRIMGTGFRQALQWTVHDREAEIALMARQRGIMRRIVDVSGMEQTLRIMEGQKRHAKGQTQVCYQGFDRQGRQLQVDGLQPDETKNAYVERCWSR